MKDQLFNWAQNAGEDLTGPKFFDFLLVAIFGVRTLSYDITVSVMNGRHNCSDIL